MGFRFWVLGESVPFPKPRTQNLRLALEEHRTRLHRGWRPAVLAVELPGRRVPDVVLDHAHAHDGRREADRTDRDGLLGQDLPDILDLLGPRRLLQAGTGPEEVKRLDQFFAFRLRPDRKSTRLNSSHSQISYAVFCLKKKT